jgi:hypothetical protein
MGRKRWAHVSKSERSLIMSELARRPRGLNKAVEEPEMPKFTWRNGRAADTVFTFDAGALERSTKRR